MFFIIDPKSLFRRTLRRGHDRRNPNQFTATYQNPARLSDLHRINYIFGANGTGKTSISRVIAQAHGHEHYHLQ
ncbi:AAA family ATPase [Xenorhabdus bovienii]|uniref:AAA family ATPase n=1 Tax=Xenorhabdus bovienii TaxID=40576 RepID=UPI003515C8D8